MSFSGHGARDLIRQFSELVSLTAMFFSPKSKCKLNSQCQNSKEQTWPLSGLAPRALISGMGCALFKGRRGEDWVVFVLLSFIWGHGERVPSWKQRWGPHQPWTCQFPEAQTHEPSEPPVWSNQVDRLPQRHLGRHVSHGCSQDFTAVMLHSLDSHLEQNRLEHFSPLFYQAGVIQPKFQTTILIS